MLQPTHSNPLSVNPTQLFDIHLLSSSSASYNSQRYTGGINEADIPPSSHRSAFINGDERLWWRFVSSRMEGCV
nr:hypothetical protein [Tanacetum cinerariifolium]